MRYEEIISELEAGRSVTFKGHGNSMAPLIFSGQKITLSPIEGIKLKKGDAVLAKVGSRFYVHKITAIDHDGRYQISNNHGHVNGWARKIYGIVTGVE